MAKNDKPHPLLGFAVNEEETVYFGDGQIASEDVEPPPATQRRPSARRGREKSMIGKVWDDERGRPAEPPPPLPPVSIEALAEEEEPGLRTLFKKVAGKALRKIADALDPDD